MLSWALDVLNILFLMLISYHFFEELLLSFSSVDSFRYPIVAEDTVDVILIKQQPSEILCVK